MFGAKFFLKALEALDSKNLRVNPMQCSRFRHQSSKCQLCTNYCPTEAISWNESLEIDADKCIGCGICANICPNGVFEANNPTNDYLLSRVAAGVKSSDQIAFICSKNQHKADPVSVQACNILIVPCLGRIDESILVGCVSLGINSISLVNGLCHNCEFKAGDIIQQTKDNANKVLSVFSVQEKLFLSSDIPGWGIRKNNTTPDSSLDLAGEQYSRRDFFKVMTRGTTKAALLAADSVIPGNIDDNKVNIRKSGLPFYLPQKRETLLKSLRKLEKPAVPILNVENVTLCQLIIGSDCDGCGMCAYFCPTGALKKIEKDEKLTITFQLSHCTGCNLCQEICHKKAISVSNEINTEKLISDNKEILFVTGVNRSSLQDQGKFLGL